MPIPVWLLKFREEHKRDPKPSELTEKQRRRLNECITESRGVYPPSVIENLESVVGLRDAGGREEVDPDRIFERLQRELVHYMPMISAHVQWLRENDPERLNAMFNQFRLTWGTLLSFPSKPSAKNPKSMRAAQSVVEGMMEACIVLREREKK